MKIAVVGKGGTGKTTAAGTIARLMGRQGLEVVALDCDANPNLGLSLGLSLDAMEQLAAVRQALEAEEVEHAPSVGEMFERFGAVGADGVRLVVVTKIDHPNPG